MHGFNRIIRGGGGRHLRVCGRKWKRGEAAASFVLPVAGFLHADSNLDPSDLYADEDAFAEHLDAHQDLDAWNAD